jgi:allantoinase
MTSLVLRSRRVLTPEGLRPASVHVRNGRIHAVDPYELAPEGVLDVGELLLTPGVVDTHVHINEPGRTEWEGFETATAAAAAGGITTVVDMPLNCIPATTTRAAAEAKLAALEGKLHVDVAFWGGVVPGNTSELEGLAAFGVPGCKCFTCPSGVDEFPHVTREHLDEALPRLRDLGLTLLVHAESPSALARAERDVQGFNPRDYTTYLRSRPREAEDEAIAMIIELCKQHHARAHIVHLSSASALPLLRRAQEEGVSISAETCLHYLTFAAEDVPAGATQFKCAPPIREAQNREELWRGLEEGTVGMVVSDHSPCTPALKRPSEGDFLGAWGGISSLQLGLSALWTSARARGHGLRRVFEWNALGPARLAGLEKRKGQIAPGFDADLVIWDDQMEIEVGASSLRHRHKVTPYAGRKLSGVVLQTYLRGELAYDARSPVASKPVGQFIPVRR